MKLLELKPLHIEEYQNSSTSSCPIQGERGIYPFNYLDFAKLDIAEEKSRRTLINSIGNAKRAFHLQVDIISDALGLGELRGARHPGFPEKLDFISKCGVISPNILRKLNFVRNKVEHDYAIPKSEEVDDYVDIVELFLMATKSVVDDFPVMIELELMEDEFCVPSLELPKLIRAEIKPYKGCMVLTCKGENREFNIKDSIYFEWLSAIIRNHLG
ncbi:hypothetical protein [Burkholderia ubonensis]|uniref:hypothetical protein n=1 Tax=Burkholderia ubonensis TaxID=101571 RepID=UPI000B020ECC|nr:hypothetical protein [Burkholderia ubonensis]